jgi:hypothetical protein
MFGGRLGALVAAEACAHDARPSPVALAVSVRFHRALHPRACVVHGRAEHIGRRLSTFAVRLEQDSRTALTALVTTAGRGLLRTLPTVEMEPDLPPSPGTPGDLSGVVEWRSQPWNTSDVPFTSWVRRIAPLDDRVWPLVAADLIGPALISIGVEPPFRVATVALDVTMHALPGRGWLRQQTWAQHDGELGSASLGLTDADGQLVAHATQVAMLEQATVEEMPSCVTGFGWGHSPPGGGRGLQGQEQEVR